MYKNGNILVWSIYKNMNQTRLTHAPFS
jgi:hypothetical protein